MAESDAPFKSLHKKLFLSPFEQNIDKHLT